MQGNDVALLHQLIKLGQLGTGGRFFDVWVVDKKIAAPQTLELLVDQAANVSKAHDADAAAGDVVAAKLKAVPGFYIFAPQ